MASTASRAIEVQDDIDDDIDKVVLFVRRVNDNDRS
jgi:hypothetical protein